MAEEARAASKEPITLTKPSSKQSVDMGRQTSKEGSQGDGVRRRSSLGKGTGTSLADLAAEKEATKPAFLKEVLNPILEQMALKYFEVGDETARLTQSYEDLVKEYIAWVESKEDLPPPDEIESAEPTKDELARLKEQNRELTRKIDEINKIENQSGAGKMQSMVRRMSNARRFSKAVMGATKGSK